MTHGLASDLPRLLSMAALPQLLGRRTALRLGLGLAVGGVAAACGGGRSERATSTAATNPTSAAPTTVAAAATAAIPRETAGPFPGDGSNGPNVLDDAGVVRRDIRSSFGSARGRADGVPLVVELTIVTAATAKPLPGAAMYLRHCDREGLYSLYSPGATEQNYLRGIQAAGDDGELSFLSVFPGAYAGRWPHMHLEVFKDLATATGTGSDRPLTTSQLALPEATCDLVYAAAGYEDSVRNMQRTSLASDGVSRDGAAQQMATVTGSVGAGFTAALTVAV